MNKKYYFLSLCLFFNLAHADLPLTVESLVSENKKLTFESSLVYGNSKSHYSEVTNTIPIQIGNHNYVNLPVQIGDNEYQSDYLATTIGLKYGIGTNSDIGISLSGSHHSQKNLTIDSKNSNTQLSDVNLTGSYQFLNDGKYPALVGFYDIGLLEKRDNKMLNFSNASFGITTYRSLDPIVLSLTAGYKYAIAKEIGGKKTKPADILFINPQVSFAANERVSLVAGATFRHIGTQKLDSQAVAKQRNTTDLSFGVGYGLNNDANLNFTATIKQGFGSSNEFRVSYSKKFD